MTACPLAQLELESNLLDSSRGSLKLQHTANSSSIRKPSSPFLKNTHHTTHSPHSAGQAKPELCQKGSPFMNLTPCAFSLRLGSPEDNSETKIHIVLRKCSRKPENASKTEEGEKSSKGVIWAKSRGRERLPDPIGHLKNGGDPSELCPHDLRQES